MKKFFSQGFTLVELLLVTTLIGILGAMVAGNFEGTQQKVKDSRSMSDIKEIQKGLEMYHSVTGGYPVNLGDANFNTNQYFQGGVVPKDKKTGNPYNFQSDGTNYIICSYKLEREDVGNVVCNDATNDGIPDSPLNTSCSFTAAGDKNFFCVENAQ